MNRRNYALDQLSHNSIQSLLFHSVVRIALSSEEEEKNLLLSQKKNKNPTQYSTQRRNSFISKTKVRINKVKCFHFSNRKNRVHRHRQN